jgi:hypothetical protein
MSGSVKSFRIPLAASLGIAGGALASTLLLGATAEIFVGAFAGVLLAALAPRPLSAGTGLIWGTAFAVIAWLGFSVGLHAGLSAHAMTGMLRTSQSAFPELAASIVCIGAPVGLGLGAYDVWFESAPLSLSWPRAIIGGGFAGVVGGWVFGKWMEQAGFFPLIAGVVHSNSRQVGVELHFSIAVIIGVTFALLFQRDVRGLGSSLGWGVTYGIFWWFLGALTLLPWLTHRHLDWTASHAASLFGSLIGHIIYGVILGLLYAIVDRLWLRLFVESDPLNREPESPGNWLLLSVGWGLVAGLAGGAAFGIVTIPFDDFYRVTALVGSHSSEPGFVAYMTMGAAIGASFGLLFRYESPNLAAGVAWGMVYGLIWWFVGTLTLYPILLGRPFLWTAAVSASQLYLLIGQLVYGAATGAAFSLLERRHAAWLAVDQRLARREARRQRPSRTSAPAVWIVLLALGVMLPVVLS